MAMKNPAPTETTTKPAKKPTRPKANDARLVRIYPNEQQKVLIAKTIGCTRLLWNQMLEIYNWCWKTWRISWLTTPADWKKCPEYAYLKEVDSYALTNVWNNLKKAISDGLNPARRQKYPKFKKRTGLKGSYTTSRKGGNIQYDPEAGTLRVPKVGVLKVANPVELPEGSDIKSVTISRDAAGRYYAAIKFYNPELQELLDQAGVKPDKAVLIATGLDYSSPHMFVNELGQMPYQLKAYHKYEKKIAKLQHKLAKKVKGSNNYYKLKTRLDRVHRRVADMRKDFAHKLSTAFARVYDVVCVETLNLAGIGNRRCHRGKNTYDNQWGMFLRFLEYKLARKGGVLVRVGRWFASSKTCHHCGAKSDVTADLKVRDWVCPVCGEHLDRDVNAAWNILTEGVRMLCAGEVEGFEDWSSVSSASFVSADGTSVAGGRGRVAHQLMPVDSCRTWIGGAGKPLVMKGNGEEPGTWEDPRTRKDAGIRSAQYYMLETAEHTER